MVAVKGEAPASSSRKNNKKTKKRKKSIGRLPAAAVVVVVVVAVQAVDIMLLNDNDNKKITSLTRMRIWRKLTSNLIRCPPKNLQHKAQQELEVK